MLVGPLLFYHLYARTHCVYGPSLKRSGFVSLSGFLAGAGGRVVGWIPRAEGPRTGASERQVYLL
jgi:hypothetical protein